MRDAFAPLFAAAKGNPARTRRYRHKAVPSPLLQRRLIFVTGKGGAGKSTVALALAGVAARRGMRTIVADMNGAGEQHEHQLAPNLFSLSIDPQSAMEEYLSVKVGGTAGQILGQSRMFSAFAMATPGMRELLSLGKIWELAQPTRRTRDAEPYDLTVVDAPASGHGAALLRTPRTFAEIARVGPVASQASAIAQTLANRDFTAIVAVATPEDLAVAETLELDEALQRERLNLDMVVLNQRHPDRFDEHDLELLRPLASAPAVQLALASELRARSEAKQAGRLQRHFGERLQSLPFLFVPRLAGPELELLGEGLSL
jgi:anion-transporting  ArsA/GET3 family ATPase